MLQKSQDMEEHKKIIDSKLLISYLRGTGSDKDRELIRHWFENDRAEEELSKESFIFWDEIDPDMKTEGYDEGHLLDSIHHKINISMPGHLSDPQQNKVRTINIITKIAAVLFLPLLLTSILFYSRTKSLTSSIAWAEIHSPYGTRTDFNLPDGSKGWLNGGSSLRFPARFTGNHREVSLIGEAYFEVISDMKKPFLVSTRNIDVKVTGTAFNVMAYPDEQNTEITLKNGRVEIFRKKSGVEQSVAVLKPDEAFTYNSKNDSGIMQQVNTSDKLSWLDGKLTFKYEPFDEVVRKLNRWYNVNIEIKDKTLNTYIYYGTFQNETLDEVLKLLQFTAPIKYRDLMRVKKPDGTFEKRKIEIYSKL